jgi:hypothetical protein
MENLNQFLKQSKIGDTYTMTFHAFGVNRLIGKPRKIIGIRSRDVIFESETSKLGSFLVFNKASDYVKTENGFDVYQEGKKLMSYARVL